MKLFLELISNTSPLGPLYKLIDDRGEAITNVNVLNVTPDYSSFGLENNLIIVTCSIPLNNVIE